MTLPVHVGSIKRTTTGKEKHWTDAWHVFKVPQLKPVKQKPSLAGQLSLFDPPPAKKTKRS